MIQKKFVSTEAIGSPVISKKTWVQTERAAHEAWARLINKKPRAAALMHHFVPLMGPQNAVVVSQKTLGKIMGVTDRTVRTAISDLVADKWISVVKLNGPGTVSAYLVNDQVAWGERRDRLVLSAFSARVIADMDDQESVLLGHHDLRKIPSLHPGELQLPTGGGEAAPAQPSITGLKPDLPHTAMENSFFRTRNEVSKLP